MPPAGQATGRRAARRWRGRRRRRRGAPAATTGRRTAPSRRRARARCAPRGRRREHPGDAAARSRQVGARRRRSSRVGEREQHDRHRQHRQHRADAEAGRSGAPRRRGTARARQPRAPAGRDRGRRSPRRARRREPTARTAAAASGRVAAPRHRRPSGERGRTTVGAAASATPSTSSTIAATSTRASERAGCAVVEPSGRLGDPGGEQRGAAHRGDGAGARAAALGVGPAAAWARRRARSAAAHRRGEPDTGGHGRSRRTGGSPRAASVDDGHSTQRRLARRTRRALASPPDGGDRVVRASRAQRLGVVVGDRRPRSCVRVQLASKWDQPLLLNDSLWYSAQAVVLARGDGFADPFYGGPSAEHGPLTPIVLAAVSWIDAPVPWQRARDDRASGC